MRTSVNFHPNIPISIGNLLTAHNDQPVRNATIVPTLAPERKKPATRGKLTYGPPGAKAPATVPTNIPRIPDSSPIHFDTISCRALARLQTRYLV